MRAKKVFCLLVMFTMLFSFTGMALAKHTKPSHHHKPSVTSPTEFFGFELGSDGNLARWSKIAEYFMLLDQRSNKIKVEEIGKSTEGEPYLVAYISSPENLAHLECLREVNAKLSDPRGLSESQVEKLIKKGKAVIVFSLGLHSTESGSAQTAPHLAYYLVTDDSEETRNIRDNVILVMLPNINPDGTNITTDWYNEWKGTEYEGALPWLYHKYGGHDDNRDAYQHNMIESQHTVKVVFRDWLPQFFMDFHEKGNTGDRLFIPPYSNPLHPYAAPLVWREMAWFGGHMALKLEENGRQGVIQSATFPGWANTSAFYRLSVYQNTVGVHSESARLGTLATPIYQELEDLRGTNAKNFPEYIEMVNFPNPWPGGWWRLGDILKNQEIIALAILELGATHKDTVLRNAYLKAKGQTERDWKPYAFVISDQQHDPLTAIKLTQKLIDLGIEVKVSTQPFGAGGVVYPSGTYVVFQQQPKSAMSKTLLERTLLYDNYWFRYPDGRPYKSDICTDTMNEFMGVTVIPVDQAFAGQFAVAGEAALIPGTVGDPAYGYVFDGRLNASFTAVNSLLAAGVNLWRLKSFITADGQFLPAGAFYVDSDNVPLADFNALASGLGVSFYGLTSAPAVPMEQVKPLKIGLFQRYRGGNNDEGWTRMVLEQYGFPYDTIMDADLTGDLGERIDVLIVPNDSWRNLYGPPSTSYPPEYRSGFGDQGVEAIHQFVTGGGRLVTFDDAYDLAVRIFGLDIVDTVAGLPTTEYFTGGSTLRAEVDISHPLGYGMPADAIVMSNTSHAFEITNGSPDYQTIVTYASENVLQSGWLIGEDYIKGKAAMVSVNVGAEGGQVVLIGFPPQNRAQTDGTYKLVFNCLR